MGAGTVAEPSRAEASGQIEGRHHRRSGGKYLSMVCPTWYGRQAHSPTNRSRMP
jgi:hypothetical protein